MRFLPYKSKENALVGKRVVSQMEVLMKELSSTNADVARTVENGNQRLNEIVDSLKKLAIKQK